MAQRDQSFFDALIAAERDRQRRMAVVNEQPRLRDLPSDAIRGLLDPMLRADLGINDAMDYYLGPTGIPDRLRAVSGLLDPGVYETGYAAADLVDPRVSDAERQMAAQDVGMAAAFAPLMFLRGGSGLANDAVQSARDDARRFVDRLNQPGPMPTTYSNPIPGLRAFHGSPHDFDRFDMSKIGTGEGAQAYGHGLYFAENEGVARSYRDALSQHTINGKPIDYNAGDDLAASWFTALGDRTKAADYLQRQIDNPPKSLPTFRSPEEIATMRQAIEILRSDAPIGKTAPSGRLYEVNINANPEDFLDWDKPLSEQPEVARLMGYEDPSKIAAEKAANYAKFSAPKSDTFEDLFKPLSMEEQVAAERLSSMPTPWGSMTGKDAYKAMQDKLGALDWPVGADAASRRTYYADAAMRASQKLREQGIPGIKYFDAMSRGAGEGSRNYVVFDENLINIVRKYGIAGAAAMLGMSQYDVAQAMEQQQPQGLLGYGVQ